MSKVYLFVYILRRTSLLIETLKTYDLCNGSLWQLYFMAGGGSRACVPSRS